jgi:hypothetical protein
LPAWVSKRDGRTVPFEADRITQALFAAAESLGRPNAFLARELTDGVLHFLEGEYGGGTPTSAQIAELVIKVVRELGQPALAAAFAEGNRRRLRSGQPPALLTAEKAPPDQGVFRFALTDPPSTVLKSCLREYSLQAIFSRDLVAAHRDGLLTLTGLEAPTELMGCLIDLSGRGLRTSQEEAPALTSSRRSGALVQALLDARLRAGTFLAIDGPEYSLTPFASASDLARNSGELGAGLEATGLAAVINLNCATPPGWAEESSEGPLFADQRRPIPPEHVDEYRTVLLENLLRPALAGRVRIDWHLGERDFSAPGETPAPRMLRLARWALESFPLSFVLDRPGQPPPLAEGIDRSHPAMLMAVGLHLPGLFELANSRRDVEPFLEKLASLARMAVSAGVQKRNFLRRRQTTQALSRGFLLDRARLVIVPVGLEAVVLALGGQGICSSNLALDLGRQILSSLCANLRQAASAASLDAGVDGLSWTSQAQAAGFALGDGDGSWLPSADQVAGLTCWAAGADAATQLKIAGHLHAAAGAGTAAVLIPDDNSPNPEEIANLLRFAWKRTEVTRLRFLRVPHQQQHLPWHET